MKTIIVATDFSDVALNAAHYAIDMAAANNADVLLVNAVSYPLVTPELTTAAGTFEIILDAAKNDIGQLAFSLAAYAAGRTNITTEVSMGDTVDELKNLAAAKKPLAVVMGVHGAGAAERIFFGSTALSAMHRLLCPLYLIPARAQYKIPLRIGLACNLSEDINYINTTALADLVKSNNSQLHILHVSRKEQMEAGKVLPQSKNLLNALIGIHPEFHYATSDDIPASIADFIKSVNLDLLVMVPAPQSFWGSIFHKSVSNNVARHITIPLFSLH